MPLEETIDSGDTALHLLVQNIPDKEALPLFEQLCTLLVRKGANVANNKQEMPLHVAARAGNASACRILGEQILVCCVCFLSCFLFCFLFC